MMPPLGTSHTELYLTNKDAQDIIPTLPKINDDKNVFWSMAVPLELVRSI